MGLLSVCGAIVPISFLIRTYFGLPTDGFFGAILPTLAATAVIGILIFSLVTSRKSR